jgi:hypothetical protein
VNSDGRRVAVLLVNRRTDTSWGNAIPEQALNDLFCGA